MDINNDIKQYLQNEDAQVSQQWCNEALKEYPYFTLPAVMYLKRNAEAEADSDLLARVAISYPNRKSLYCLLGENA